MENKIEIKKTKREAMPVFFKILMVIIVGYLLFTFVRGALFGGDLRIGEKSSMLKSNNSSQAVGAMMHDESAMLNEVMLEPAISMDSVSGFGGDIEMGRSAMIPPVEMQDNREELKMDKRIIKNGYLNLKVDNASESADKISEIVTGLGGEIFASNSNQQRDGGLRGNMTVKIPVSVFDEAMDSIKEVSEKIISESVSASDVTSEYIDLQARLNNKKEEENTFKKLLERTGNLQDILSVTREISRVRGQIESIEGQLKYMSRQTDMSTINVTLVEFVQITSERNSWKPWRTVTNSLHNLVINAQNFADKLINFVIVKLPFLILVTLLLLGGYKGSMKIYKKFKR